MGIDAEGADGGGGIKGFGIKAGLRWSRRTRSGVGDTDRSLKSTTWARSGALFLESGGESGKRFSDSARAVEMSSAERGGSGNWACLGESEDSTELGAGERERVSAESESTETSRLGVRCSFVSSG